ncbi:MAG: hypothetical protein AAGM67_13390, partial [Bacteroidota bacterium]
MAKKDKEALKALIVFVLFTCFFLAAMYLYQSHGISQITVKIQKMNAEIRKQNAKTVREIELFQRDQKIKENKQEIQLLKRMLKQC